MERVAILDLGQPTDHEGTGIFRAEKLDLAEPLQKLLTLRIRWLLVLIVGRHVVRFHDAKRLLPAPAGRGFAGLLEGRAEVDSALLPILPVTTCAVGSDEWGDYFFEGLPGIGLQRGEIRVVRGHRSARQGQRQRKG